MTGWILFAALAIAAMIALRFAIGGRSGGVGMIAAVLLVAAAGYAWQGNPGLAGHPVTPADTRPPPDPLFAEERKEWLETVGPDPQVLDAADTWIARGEPDYAVGILRGALSREPRSAMLWLGLGNALVHYADGSVTPAARYAFDRAAALSPGAPAPAYFLGLAYALSGDAATADQIWRKLVIEAPGNAPWRMRVGLKLMLLERLRSER